MVELVRLIAPLGGVDASRLAHRQLEDGGRLAWVAGRAPLARQLVRALHQPQQRLFRQGIDASEAPEATEHRAVQPFEAAQLCAKLAAEPLAAHQHGTQRVQLVQASEARQLSAVPRLCCERTEACAELPWLERCRVIIINVDQHELAHGKLPKDFVVPRSVRIGEQLQQIALLLTKQLLARREPALDARTLGAHTPLRVDGRAPRLHASAERIERIGMRLRLGGCAHNSSGGASSIGRRGRCLPEALGCGRNSVGRCTGR